MKDEETIKISVWFNEIENEKIEKAVVRKLQREINSKNISEDCLELYKIDNTYKKDSDESETKLSISEIQKINSIFLQTKSKFYTEYNKTCIAEIVESYDIDEVNIKYTSKYVPNAEAVVSKSEVYSLIENDNIESVYAVSTVLEKDDSSASPDSVADLTTISTNDVYDYTGINYMRNSQNESGSGIKIGLISYGKPNTSYSCFNNANINNRINILDSNLSVSNDATFLAAQLVGKVGSIYEGIAINSTLYCTGTTGTDEDSWKECFDDVLESNVNIIDVGIELAGEDRNEYGDASKYIDAIVNTENVTVIQGTGEGYPSGSGSVQRGAMAYNSIAVGMYRMNYDDVSPLSAYNMVQSIWETKTP